jgi:hypothetical protein
MGEEPIQYIKPHWFDWGVYKENGGLIFFTTAAVYLACFVVSVALIWRIGRRLDYPWVILAVGLAALAPMVFRAVESLERQMTSAHYQERIHIPAVITIAASFGAVVILWLAVEWRHRRTKSCT